VIVVDTSAIVAILAGEPEGDALMAALEGEFRITTSPVAVYEATLGLARVLRLSVEDAETDVMEFLRLARVVVQPIQPETAHIALKAFARYGKGRGHPARLNLGDCFIYAQAKAAGASLLYKGEDFSKTDIESAA
jgi:ribonuclease VapC